MAKIRIPYLVTRINADGSKRYYWQPDATLRAAAWKQRRLPDQEAQAMAEAQAINERVRQWRAGETLAVVNDTPGTIDAVISAYRKSRYFKEKSPRTRKDYDHYLHLIGLWAGDTPAAAITARMVQALYESGRKKNPRKAAYLIQVLRLLFNFAERESLIPKNSNPAAKPMIDYKAAKGTIWSREAVQHFIKTADEMDEFSIGTAIMLNEWMGQRRGDTLRISIKDYRDGVIYLRQNKTAAEVQLPVALVPELKARLDAQISKNRLRKVPGTALIQQDNGKPYSGDGFLDAFERVRLKAAVELPEIKKLIFKDLRHTAVTRLAEAGAEVPQIAAVTGHTFKSCQEIIDRYNVRTKRMAHEAFQRRLASEAAAQLEFAPDSLER